MTEEELARIEATIEATTAGDWAPFGKQVISDQLIIVQTRNEADSYFIATAHAALPRLLAEVRRLRAALLAAGDAGDLEEMGWIVRDALGIEIPGAVRH